MLRRTFRIGVLTLSMALLAGPVLSEEPPIVIPAITPMSGAVAAIGQDVRKGIELAVDQINQAGGIGGRPLKVEVVDTQSKPDVVHREMERLIQLDKAPIIIGCESSGGTAAAAQFAEQAQVPYLNALAAADVFSRGYHWYFSEQVTNEDFGEAAVAFVKAIAGPAGLGAVKVAVLHEDSENGSGNAAIIKRIFAKDGQSLVADVSYSRSERNMLPFMRRVQDSDPQILIWSGYAGDTIAGLAVLKQLAFYPYVVGIGGAMGDPRLPHLADPALLTRLHASNIDYFSPDIDRAKAFTAAFKARFGIEPSSYAASCYPAVFTVKAAYEAALTKNKDPSRADLRDALRSLDIPGAQTITPAASIHFDATGRNLGARAMASQWVDEGRRKVPVWPPEVAAQAPAPLK